jgi:aryl-alcohol dehydrogenase-like predicted oxidoreductase
MRTRTLGPNGPAVSAVGLGCMSMTDMYGLADEAECIATLERAIELGVTFWDTADMYGPHRNEVLLGKALAGRQDKVFLATKCGFVRDRQAPGGVRIDGSPAYVKQAAEASLSRLNIETIDLYYLHRVDRNTPIEDTMGAMADLVKAGKIRHVGLSECSAATLERACKVHPVTAVQSEYSLWTRDPDENGVLDACRRLGVGFVPYSPLGRGFLSGEIRSPDDFEKGDWRRHAPRFVGENFTRNLDLVDKVRALASAKGCTASQLALAWTMARSEHVVPIPGTKRRSRLEENAGAADVLLTAQDMADIEAVCPAAAVAGPRYTEQMMAATHG